MSEFAPKTLQRCEIEDCLGYFCGFHALPHEAQEYIFRLEEVAGTAKALKKANDYWREGGWKNAARTQKWVAPDRLREIKTAILACRDMAQVAMLLRGIEEFADESLSS